MTEYHQEAEHIFKKGEIVYRQGEYVPAIFDVLRGQVALYVDYQQPSQRLLTEVADDGFFGLVGFLENRMPPPWRWKRRHAASSPMKTSGVIFRSGPPRS